MGERLGQLVLRRGLVEPHELEQALESQVLLGARLGTNLVEANAIGLDELAEALAELRNLPPAKAHHFQRADAALQARLSPRAAARWHAVPLGPLETGTIAVAVRDPLPPEGRRELSSYLEADIVEAVAPELRVLFELEARYGLRRPNRFLRAPPRRPTSVDAERRNYVPAITEAEGARGEPIGRLQIQRIAVPAVGAPAETAEPETYNDALKALRRATGRERVAELAIAGIRRAFAGAVSAGVLFVIRDGLACGWRGFCPAGESLIDDLAVALGEPSVLARTFQRGPFAGPAPAEPDPIDRTLWALLGDAPASVAAAPIDVAGKTACLMYAHSPEPGALTAASGHRLSELAQATTAALTFLLRSAER